MVIVVCDCLNIRIHARGSSLASIDLSTGGSLADSFFEAPVAPVILDLAGITKAVVSLTKVRSIGDWSITSCLNCGKDVYAVHNVQGTEQILVGLKLQNDQASITEIMASDRYSPLYKIVLVPKNDVNQNKKDLGLLRHRSEGLEASLATLQSQLNKYLQRERESLDERIRSYVEKERTAYNSLQNRVREDKEIISRLLLETEEYDLRNSLTEAMLDSSGLTPPMTPIGGNNNNIQSSNSPTMNSGEFRDQLNSEEQDQVLAEIQKPPSHRPRPQSFGRPLHGKVPMRKRGLSHNPPFIARSLDIEGIFDLEGVDDEVPPFYQSDNEVDADDNIADDVFKVDLELEKHPPKEMYSHYAASVPISVPAWSSNSHHFSVESDDERVYVPGDPERMAESIKAIARSIHTADGSAMFGELPRPRLNTMD